MLASADNIRARARQLALDREGRIKGQRFSRREWMRAAAPAAAAFASARPLTAWSEPTLLPGSFGAPTQNQPEQSPARIQFSAQTLPFRLDSDETPKFPHAPATMAGGCAVFDYNKDGRRGLLDKGKTREFGGTGISRRRLRLLTANGISAHLNRKARRGRKELPNGKRTVDQKDVSRQRRRCGRSFLFHEANLGRGARHITGAMARRQRRSALFFLPRADSFFRSSASKSFLGSRRKDAPG